MAWAVVVAGEVGTYCVFVRKFGDRSAEKVEMGYTYGRVDGADDVSA